MEAAHGLVSLQSREPLYFAKSLPPYLTPPMSPPNAFYRLMTVRDQSTKSDITVRVKVPSSDKAILDLQAGPDPNSLIAPKSKKEGLAIDREELLFERPLRVPAGSEVKTAVNKVDGTIETPDTSLYDDPAYGVINIHKTLPLYLGKNNTTL